MSNENSLASVMRPMTAPEARRFDMPPARGLMVREPWARLILDGKKSWEIRGTRTAIRGLIYIIPSGSGRIAGACEIVDVFGPLSVEDMMAHTAAHLTPADELLLTGLPYKNTYAWVLANPQRFEDPIPYKHPSGAITWVDLEELRKELPCQRDSEWRLTEHSVNS